MVAAKGVPPFWSLNELEKTFVLKLTSWQKPCGQCISIWYRHWKVITHISPRLLPQWQTQYFTDTTIKAGREQVQAIALPREATASITVFLDAPEKEKQLVAAAVALDCNQ